MLSKAVRSLREELERDTNTYAEAPEATWEGDRGISFLEIHSVLKQIFIRVPSVCQALFKAPMPASWDLLVPYIAL